MSGAPSPIPPEIEALVARTVKRARLRRSEREDVARELRSHFQSALDDGRSIDDIARAFGDPRAAGRLIGRAKRRCRSPLWHAWVWSCRGVAALLALVLVTYAWAAWAYYGAEPTITRNYLKEINERIAAIPENDRAWPLYREALLSIPEADFDGFFEIGDEDFSDWEGARALLTRHTGAIGLILSGSQRSVLGAPVSPLLDPDLQAWRGEHSKVEPWWEDPDNPPLLAAVNTWSFAVRYLGAALRAQAVVALQAGDVDLWKSATIAGFRLSAQVGERSTLIEYLVAMSIDAMFDRAVRDALATHPTQITNHDLVAISDQIAEGMRWKGRIPFDGERRIAEDLIQRVYNDSTGRITDSGIGLLASYYGQLSEFDAYMPSAVRPPALLGPVNAAIIAPRGKMLKRTAWMYDTWKQRSLTPLLHRGPSEVDRWTEDQSDALSVLAMRWFPLFVTTSAGEATMRLMDQRIQMATALRAAIAVELYLRDTGRLPETLHALVPDYLPDIPTDIFSGRPLRYLKEKGIPIIYSVGCDMDDDQSRIPSKSYGRYARSAAAWGPPRTNDPEWWTEERIREHDGDWILWPPIDPDTGEFIYAPRTEGPR